MNILSKEEYDKLPRPAQILYMHGVMQSVGSGETGKKLDEILKKYLQSKNISYKDVMENVHNIIPQLIKAKPKENEDN